MKNRLLCILITEFQQHPSELLTSFMLIVFSPAINSIASKKKQYFPDDLGGLLGELRKLLLEIVKRYDCNARPNWVAKEIKRRTKNALDRFMERQLYGKMEFTGDELPGTAVDCTIPGLELSFFELLAKKGIITEQATAIIIATRVNERSIRKWAEGAGIAYDAAKKQRQRAEKAIKAFMQQQKIAYAESKNVSVKTVSFQDVMRWIFEQKL